MTLKNKFPYAKIARAFALSAGLTYTAAAEAGQEQGAFIGAGMASWYGEEMAKGRDKNGNHIYNRTASGQIFNPNRISAAHRTLPLPRCVRVESNGKSRMVNVNDRGPYARSRVLDLSRAAAEWFGVKGKGHFHVRMYDTGMKNCPK